MKKCIQDLVKNTSQVEIWIRISKVFIVSKRPEALFMTFTHLRNVESTSSIENIMIFGGETSRIGELFIDVSPPFLRVEIQWGVL